MQSNRDIDSGTGMPPALSLGEVLASIELTPGEVSTLLANWADDFLSGSHHNMGLKLRDYARMLSDPATYGYKAPAPAAPTSHPEYVAPEAPKFAQRYDQSPVAATHTEPTGAVHTHDTATHSATPRDEPITDAERDELNRLRAMVGNEPSAPSASYTPPFSSEGNPPS